MGNDSHILATSAGWEETNEGMRFSPLQKYAIDLAGVSGRRARVGFVNSASGDQTSDETRDLAAAAASGVRGTHIRLFRRNLDDLRQAVLEQDVIWVSGGSLINLLALWRAHGLDAIMREAWENGVVLAGSSAGAICWHSGGTTTSYSQPAVIADGLGLVSGSLSPHFDSQPIRRSLMCEAVASGTLPSGYGLEEGTAVHYLNGAATAFLRESDQAQVYQIASGADRAMSIPIATTRVW